MTLPLSLGAPGIYRDPQTAGPPLLAGEPMDVCAFVGVAPRGPVREPELGETWRYDRPCVEPGRRRRRSLARAVESLDEYRRLYGGFTGPGRLPYAVAAFFEQGGRRAYVVRVVHDYGKIGAGVSDPRNAQGVARGSVSGAVATAGELDLVARNEGAWGNALRAALGFASTPLDFDDEQATVRGLVLDESESLPVGTLLRLTLEDHSRTACFVGDARRVGEAHGSGRVLVASFDRILAARPLAAEVVTGVLLIDDGDGRRERHTDLGLSSKHRRWMGTVLCYESELVYPGASWVDGDLLPADLEAIPAEPVLETTEPPQFGGGEDRDAEIVPQDFFDDNWRPADGKPGSGVCALAHLADLSAVVVPDLYCPDPLPARGTPLAAPPAPPAFVPCADLQPAPGRGEEPAGAGLEGLHLHPLAELSKILALQRRLVRWAEALRSFVVLLDVPPELGDREILRWRSRLHSSYAAAYHPWLRVSRSDDQRDALIDLNPSAVAAGIIARQEHRFGVPHGPANVLATGVLDVTGQVSPRRHDELHQAGINVYLRERDGVLLAAARTLSRDPLWRQLSVRRLLLLLRRVLERQTHWMVFETNGSALRADVRRMLRGFLRQLFRSGAFRGASEEEAFFVRCDEVLNPPWIADAGRLVAEIGVAPAEPIEFIVLRLTVGGDGVAAMEVSS